MINISMRVNEVIKQPSADKLRIDALKRQKEQASKALQTAKARAKIQSGEAALHKAMT
jgi:hypothetical protein